MKQVSENQASCEWWTDSWTDEQKRIAGDPKARIAHRQRLTKSVDRFEKRMNKQLAKEFLNYNVN